MGKLIICFAFSLAWTSSHAQDGIPQSVKDSIREYRTKEILGSGQNLTHVQEDVALIRKELESQNGVSKRTLPEFDKIPWVQLYKRVDLEFGQILMIASLASGYDLYADESVNLSQKVKINNQPNSLLDIAIYLSNKTKTDITLYPESRSVVVTPLQRVDK